MPLAALGEGQLVERDVQRRPGREQQVDPGPGELGAGPLSGRNSESTVGMTMFTPIATQRASKAVTKPGSRPAGISVLASGGTR